jgi:hypothetical protein
MVLADAITEEYRESVLLDYACRWYAMLPRSRTHEILELDELELEVSLVLDDADWYVDLWPGTQYVLFFSDHPSVGRTSTYGVHLDTNYTVKLA